MTWYVQANQSTVTWRDLALMKIMNVQLERLQLLYLASVGDGTRPPPTRTVRGLPM